MPFIETIEGNANCAACKKLQANKRGRSDFSWVCRTKGLTGAVDVPLPHPKPETQTTAVLGIIISQIARNAAGAWFGCQFEPREGTRVDLRVHRDGGRNTRS